MNRKTDAWLVFLSPVNTSWAFAFHCLSNLWIQDACGGKCPSIEETVREDHSEGSPKRVRQACGARLWSLTAVLLNQIISRSGLLLFALDYDFRR